MPDPPLSFSPSDEQRRAIEAEGVVFVSAGAGTGKTRVLVERFARAVLERGLAPDRVLAITYTERAAAELQARIRRRLAEAGRPELARALDGAWISTIHGFCQRVLHRHALSAGLDPAFTVLDQSAADLLRAEAYTTALETMADRDEDVLDLIASYGEDRLQQLIDSMYERLRSAGGPVAFPPPPPDAFADRIAVAAAAAATLAAAEGEGERLAASIDRARELGGILDASPDPLVLADCSRFRSLGKLAIAAGYDAALLALEQAARDRIYADLHQRLDDLLQAFAAEYAGRKRGQSVLDFDDLQLEVRDLLGRDAVVRAGVQFADVMVDEFQDTNALQCEIIDQVAAEGATLFFVGDEFQSIYRFRHADVDVFRQRQTTVRATPGAATLSLRTNYRSRPDVLAAVNHLFGSVFGEDYEPLDPGGSFPDLDAGEPRVEFLVTDADRARALGEPARVAEARELARRLRELVDAGLHAPRDIVLLFAAATDAGLYETALQRVGLQTAAATGRHYFEHQPVRDVAAFLSLVRNRYDDAALLAVLASPMVGVTNDTLALMRAAAPRRALFTAIEQGIPAGTPPEDAQLLAAFRQRFERLVDASGRISLQTLIERIVEDHDYDLALLRDPAGTRRLANVRKLARLAGEYEELRGPDLEGFLETVELRRLAQSREPDALVAEEAADAVVLMTVHAAKGLEFPVVVVADAGRRQGSRSDSVVALPDGRVGIRVPDVTGKTYPTSAYESARDADVAADDDERRRVSYVALTRAVDRLIVSGCVTARQIETGATPVAWMLATLGVALEEGEQVVDVPGGRVAVRVTVPADDETESRPVVEDENSGQLVLFADPGELAPLPPPAVLTVPPALAPLPVAPPERPGRLSFSALHLHERCGYRFYAERVLGFPPAPRPDTGHGGLSGAELGTVVHELLERPDRSPEDALQDFPPATDDDRQRIDRLIATWHDSELAALVAGLEAQPEVAFLLDVDGVVLAGRMDVVARAGDEVHVIDYKTNRIGEVRPEEIRDADYGLQEAVYALAMLDAGCTVVHVHFAFLDVAEVVTRSFGVGDASPLRERVGAAVAAATAGPYVPRPGDSCRECPVLGLLCAGPDLDGMHAAPEPW